MNPGTVSFLELLAREEKARFTIPPWRRQYVWNAKDRDRHEVEKLWQDLRSKCVGGAKLFCGVVLLYKLEKEDAPTWEIVDGQQRIATLFLLLMALRDVCEKRGVDCTDLNNLIRASNSNRCRLVLQGESGNDRLIMNALFNRTAFSLDQKTREESNLFRAYRYLLEKIESDISSDSQEFLVSVLQDVEFRIELVDSLEKARRAFETLDAQDKQADVAKVPVAGPPAKKTMETPVASASRSSRFSPSRRNVALAGLGLVLILSLVVAWNWYNYTRIRIASYQGGTERFGVPEGIGKLSEDQARPRSVHYQIESTRQKVQRMSAIGGSGLPVESPALYHASTEEIQYGENGRLAQIVFLDRNGREVFRKVYSDAPGGVPGNTRYGIEFKSQLKRPSANPSRNFSLLGQNSYSTGNDFDGKASVTGETVDYTTEGRLSHIQFHNGAGQPCANINGVFARNFEYNPAGQVVKLTNLGPEGKPAPDKHGITSVTRTFDTAGKQIDETLLDAKGQPAVNPGDCAKVAFKYDDRGNIIEVAYFGIDGKPVFNKQGFAQVTAKYDEHSNLIEQSCRGIDGALVMNSDGYSTETLKYDPRGEVLEAGYLGVDGKPVLIKDGYATEKLTYDEHGNILVKAYFDIDAKPQANKYGCASESSKYDESGNAIEVIGLGVDGNPVLSTNGYAKVTFKFNDRGDKIEAAYFDVAGQPVLNKNGVARETYEYDGNDNVIGQSYFGVDGQPVLNKDGAAKLAAKYDERGNVLETTCFGLDGQPVLDRNGVSRETYKYDKRDNVIEAACFGTDDNPVLDRGGVAKAVFQYDAHGNKLQSDYFGLDGNSTLTRGGFSRETFKYDERGNTIEGAYFNNGGQATLGPNGFAKETLKYDERDRIVEAACFGIEGQSIELGGAHRIVYAYDASGKVSKTERFDRNDQLIP